MISGKGLFCAVALISTVGVVVCARDLGEVKSGGSLNHVDAVSGLRKMLQISQSDKALIKASTKGDNAGVQKQLGAGANPNALDLGGVSTPLNRASLRGHVDVVQTLLNAGVDVNLANKQGLTALHYAAINGDSNIVGLLLEKGADPSREDTEKWTPLFFASRDGHAEALRKLIDAGGNVSHQDRKGWTPLHLAADYGNSAVVKLLLEKGANTGVETFDTKDTPLIQAAISGSGLIIKALIDAGADKNHKNAASNTPLIEAAYYGNQEAVEILVENGADKSIIGQDNWNAKQSVCQCTTESRISAFCDLEACDAPGRMKSLLDP